MYWRAFSLLFYLTYCFYMLADMTENRFYSRFTFTIWDYDINFDYKIHMSKSGFQGKKSSLGP